MSTLEEHHHWNVDARNDLSEVEVFEMSEHPLLRHLNSAQGLDRLGD
jgi:hypothetical protein